MSNYKTFLCPIRLTVTIWILDTWNLNNKIWVILNTGLFSVWFLDICLVVFIVWQSSQISANFFKIVYEFIKFCNSSMILLFYTDILSRYHSKTIQLWIIWMAFMSPIRWPFEFWFVIQRPLSYQKIQLTYYFLPFIYGQVYF